MSYLASAIRRTGLQKLCFSAWVLCLTLAAWPCRAQIEDPLILAVHPYLPYEEIQQRFAPLAARLESLLGIQVEIRVGTNYQDHIEAIGEDKVTLAFVGPAVYAILTRQYGPKPILGVIETAGVPTFKGHIIVRQDSPLTSLTDLAGKRLAFVDPYSTMNLVPYSMMRMAGLSIGDLKQHVFLGSHRNVALGVLAGDFAAGAVKEEVFREFQNQGLRSLIETMVVPEHVFVARRGLPPGLLVRLREAIQNLDRDADGLSVLASIKSTCSGVATGQDSDYDFLRQMLHQLEE